VEQTTPGESGGPDELVVLWTSGDREVALKVAFMYTLNSKLKGWWKEVTLIVWGPSSKLISVDTELQGKLAEMQEAGVKVRACRSCSDAYGVTVNMERMGITVEYMGQPLTEFLKSDGSRVITF
jgi:hypothetical protein